MRRLIITEEEKKDILNMYDVQDEPKDIESQIKSEVERLGLEAKEKVKREIERQEKVTKDVSTDYEKRLDYLRDTYNRLRDSRSGGVPSVPEAPRSIDEIPANAIPLGAVCAETTQQLISLQEWIKAQSN